MEILKSIKDFFDLVIYKGDKIQVTLGLIFFLFLAIIATTFVMRLVQRLFTRRMEVEDRNKFVSFFTVIKYLVYVVIVSMTMNLAGVDTSAIVAASAALFVAIGFALQDLFKDLISGILIILDKSLLVGHIIEIDGKVGRVIEIRLRTTRLITRDDKVIIIPNHLFMTDTLLNYTQNHKSTLERVGVGVAYGSDTLKVERIMLEAVSKQKGVLKTPKPFVLFQNFGDSSLDFEVLFHVSDAFVDPRTKSEIRFRIDQMFRENNITIPFPQRDVHLFNTTHLK